MSKKEKDTDKGKDKKPEKWDTHEVEYYTYKYHPVVWAEDILGIQLDDWQKKVLRSDSKRIILNCSRQSGKSTITAIAAMHHAIYNPDAVVLVVSGIDIQAKETFMKITNTYRLVPEPPEADTDSVFSMRLANGSRIEARSAANPQNLRSYSGVTLLIIDEASRVKDEAYLVLKPMLTVSNGKLMILSTPAGRRGFFYNAWKGATEEDNEGNWLAIKVTADECPRIPRSDIEEARLEYPDYAFREEYYCEFSDNTSEIFPHVGEAFTDEEDEWDFDLDLGPVF